MTAGCPSSRALSGLGLIAVIVMQLILVARWVSPAAAVLKAQFGHLNVSGEVHTITQTPFWGPVKVVIPEECDVIRAWSTAVKQALSADSVAEPDYCHSHSWQGLNLTAEGLTDDDNGRRLMDGRSLFAQLFDMNQEDFGLQVQPPAVRSLGLNASNDSRAGFLPVGHQDTAPDVHRAKAAAAAALATMKNHSHAILKRLFKAERRARTFQVVQCGQNMTFERPPFSNRYFSMVMLDRLSSSGKPTFAETVEQRTTIFNQLVVCIVISMSLKYLPKLVFVGIYFFGDSLSICRGTRSRFDRGLESLLLHSISSLFLITQQISLCTVFLIFWRGGHFVMSHIPNAAYMFVFCSVILLEVVNELDKVFSWTTRFCTTKLTVIFWSCWVVWMSILTIPLIGSAIYSIQYLFILRRCGWANSETAIFSPEYGQAAGMVSDACVGFVVLAVIEQVAHFSMEMSEAARTVPQVPVHAFPHRSKHYHILEFPK